MPTTVYTLLCQTDRTGYVLAVFTDRAHAAEVARANAATHAERLRRQDERPSRHRSQTMSTRSTSKTWARTSPSSSATAS